MEERIKAIYNECWVIYKQYLEHHDMAQYNTQKDELLDKFDGQPDITGLLWWWAGRVNGLHEEYMRCEHETGRQEKGKPYSYLPYLRTGYLPR